MNDKILQDIKRAGSVDPSLNDSEKNVADLIEKMPSRVKEAYFAMSTADKIYKAAAESKIQDDLVPDIAFLLGDVFLGLLNPENFARELVNFGVEETTAVNFYRLISQSLLLQIKDDLDQIYNTSSANSVEITAPSTVSRREVPIIRVKIEPPSIRNVSAPAVASQPNLPNSTDPYREPVNDVVDLSENTMR